MTTKQLILLLAPLATGNYSYQMPAPLVGAVRALVQANGREIPGVPTAKLAKADIATNKARLIEVLEACTTEEGSQAYKFFLPASLVQALRYWLENFTTSTETDQA